MAAFPSLFNTAAWEVLLVEYYTQNAPEKVALVNDTLLNKWHGKYDELYRALENKYGALGRPKSADTGPSKVATAAKTGKPKPKAPVRTHTHTFHAHMGDCLIIRGIKH
jgi:hypothetical protein